MTSQSGKPSNIFQTKHNPTADKLNTIAPAMIEVIVNDRMGKKERIKA